MASLDDSNSPGTGPPTSCTDATCISVGVMPTSLAVSPDVAPPVVPGVVVAEVVPPPREPQAAAIRDTDSRITTVLSRISPPLRHFPPRSRGEPDRAMLTDGRPALKCGAVRA